MKATKFLENKRVIQFFGAALLVAPFMNALLFIFLQKTKNSILYKDLSFWSVLMTGTPLHYALAIGSIAIGLIMLSGSQKAWSYVLALLGTHIAIQLYHLGENMRQNWMWGMFFVINAAIFMFIADQLVFKLKLPEKKFSPPQTQQKIKKLPRVVIGFQGFGAWAELVEVNEAQIQVRKLKEPPHDIEKRFVEFSFKKGITLKAKFKNSSLHNYYFEFVNLKPNDSQELNSWIDRNAS